MPNLRILCTRHGVNLEMQMPSYAQVVPVLECGVGNREEIGKVVLN